MFGFKIRQMLAESPPDEKGNEDLYISFVLRVHKEHAPSISITRHIGEGEEEIVTWKWVEAMIHFPGLLRKLVGDDACLIYPPRIETQRTQFLGSNSQLINGMSAVDHLGRQGSLLLCILPFPPT